MIELEQNEILIRSELSILFCFLEDFIEGEDINKAKEELRSITKQLAYLVLDEG
ncbi:MAG: hypothetical protein R3F51_23250 [Cyanobacteriota/Melainabacteria group bacterium]